MYWVYAPFGFRLLFIIIFNLTVARDLADC